MSEEKEVLKCKTCGHVAEDGEKFFKKTEECNRCYQARWQREKRGKDAAGTVDKPAPKPALPKPQPVKTAPKNGTGDAIMRIDGEIEDLENQKEIIEYKLSVLRDVRGMLG